MNNTSQLISFNKTVAGCNSKLGGTGPTLPVGTGGRIRPPPVKKIEMISPLRAGLVAVTRDPSVWMAAAT